MSATDTSTFPVRPLNRPALPHVVYRIGAYPEMVDAMLRQINASTELARWTHRKPDDPGIALVESAAVVADILTFYQEHYANEAFLRTAQWRESIQELVRITGYRLAPGLGGRTNFALEVKGTAPVLVPVGFPLKAELADVPDPVDFQTVAEHTAIPHLSRFHLYRARNVTTGLAAGSSKFEIIATGGSANPAVLAALDLKKGDKLVLVPAAPTWLSSGSTVNSQATSQTVKVSAVIHQLGRVIVEIEGSLQRAWSGSVTAYRIGRSFRHFGHNSPLKVTYQTDGTDGLEAVQVDAHLDRHISQTCWGAPSFLHTHLPETVIPLDQEVSDLSLGARVILDVVIKPNSTTDEQPLTLARTIESLQARTMSWGNINGPSTWITLASRLVPNGNSAVSGPTADIRRFRISEVTSESLSLRRVVTHPSGNFTDSNQLFIYATADDAAELIERTLLLQADDGRVAEAVVADVDLSGATWARMRRVTLHAAPKGFSRADFREETPTVTVFGNVVPTTQGKGGSPVVLGNGDARQVFQTFKLPKAPLTYLHDPAATPSHVPELTIRVNGRAWTRVDSFFARVSLEEIYIVREDAEGKSYVQFGDGETGARLPSGVQNVTAEYRSGGGALGLVKPGTKPSAGARLDGLDKVQLPGEVTGGAQPEDLNKAREAAPGKLQSLGRLVSLKDYESEALATAGVVAAAAAWDIADGSPAVALRILLEEAQQSDAQFEAVAASLRAADRARGPDRYPIEVTQCELRYVHLNVTYAFDPALRVDDVDTALRAALGLVGDEVHTLSGLFGLRRRALGEREYALRVEGILQNVSGIVWCRVVHFGVLPAGNDPDVLAVPSVPTRAEQIICAPTEMLQLHALHLTLTPAANV